MKKLSDADYLGSVSLLMHKKDKPSETPFHIETLILTGREEPNFSSPFQVYGFTGEDVKAFHKYAGALSWKTELRMFAAEWMMAPFKGWAANGPVMGYVEKNEARIQALKIPENVS